MTLTTRRLGLTDAEIAYLAALAEAPVEGGLRWSGPSALPDAGVLGVVEMLEGFVAEALAACR